MPGQGSQCRVERAGPWEDDGVEDGGAEDDAAGSGCWSVSIRTM